MKIGLARRGFSPSGGAERYLKRFGEALKQDGFEAVLFTSPEWPTASWSHGERIPVPGETPMEFANHLRDADPMAHCDFLFSLERVHACDAYRAGDGVHKLWLERREGYEAAWRRRTRFLNRKHAQILELEEEMLGCGTAGRVIVNSNMVRREIRDIYGYPDDRIHTVYNGVPMRSFERAAGARRRIRQELLMPDHELFLFFAGSGWERKGLRYAIDAVEQLPPDCKARLVVAGKGSRMRFRSRKVVYLGEVDSILPYLEAADLFILPTTYDPFSNACLEALANGVPVVTTRLNGFHEIMGPDDGAVVEAPDAVDALVDAILQWRDPEKREIARERLRERALEFSIEANLKATMQALGITQS